MKRREFFKSMIGVAATLVLAKLPKAEPEVIGVDMAAKGADATVVSLHETNRAASDDLGGYLVPQEHVDELMTATKAEDRKNNVFRGTSQTVTWRERESEIVSLRAERDLLVANFKQVHRDFAQFLKSGRW